MKNQEWETRSEKRERARSEKRMAMMREASPAFLSLLTPHLPLLIRIAELLQHRLVVHPAFAHLHPQLEEDLALEQALHVPARGRADGLELGAALADHDGLLAVTLHPDHRVDLGDTV